MNKVLAQCAMPQNTLHAGIPALLAIMGDFELPLLASSCMRAEHTTRAVARHAAAPNEVAQPLEPLVILRRLPRQESHVPGTH